MRVVRVGQGIFENVDNELIRQKLKWRSGQFCSEHGQLGGTTQDNDGLSYVFRALGADCPGHEEAVTNGACRISVSGPKAAIVV